MSDRDSVYARVWDNYVEELFPRIQSGKPFRPEDLKPWQVLNTTSSKYAWPGDEWGDEASVSHILDTCVTPYLSPESHVFCEIASGGGRFTRAVLEKYPKCQISCFDISSAFLNRICERFSAEVANGRVSTFLITDDPQNMYADIAAAQLLRKVDCVYSFDAMVHVEIHSIVIYLATAASILRPGGLVAMNVADATNAHGVAKLLNDAPGVFRQQGRAGLHFQFASWEIIENLLSVLGFTSVRHDCNGRDLFFSAHLKDPDAVRNAFADAGSRWTLDVQP